MRKIAAQGLLKLFINGIKNIASLLPPLALEPNYILTCQHYTIHAPKDETNTTTQCFYINFYIKPNLRMLLLNCTFFYFKQTFGLHSFKENKVFSSNINVVYVICLLSDSNLVPLYGHTMMTTLFNTYQIISIFHVFLVWMGKSIPRA